MERFDQAQSPETHFELFQLVIVFGLIQRVCIPDNRFTIRETLQCVSHHVFFDLDSGVVPCKRIHVEVGISIELDETVAKLRFVLCGDTVL